MSIYPRTNYEMTEDDLKRILDACKPTPVMFLSGGAPMCDSPQENANRAWKELGQRMGFDHMTVQPDRRGNRFFTAVPSETPEQRSARELREKEESKRVEIAKLEAEVKALQERLAVLLNTTPPNRPHPMTPEQQRVAIIDDVDTAMRALWRTSGFLSGLAQDLQPLAPERYKTCRDFVEAVEAAARRLQEAKETLTLWHEQREGEKS